MVQATDYETGRFSDSTTSGATRGDSISDNFYQQFSTSDIKQYYDNQRASYADSGQGRNQAVSGMLGGFSIDEGTSTSANIWDDGQKGRQYFSSGKSDGSGYDLKYRPLDEGNGKADQYFGKGESSFSYDQIQMNAGGDGMVSKDPKPGDGAAAARRRAYESLQREAGTSGDSDVNREKAAAMGKKLLDGKDITKELQELPEAQRIAVMRELKRQLADTPGTTVTPTENRHPSDSSQDTRTIQIKTGDGTTVVINESRNGLPNRIQVNNPSWFMSSVRGARDVYVSPATAQREATTGSGQTSNPVLRIREMTQPTQEERERLQRQREGG